MGQQRFAVGRRVVGAVVLALVAGVLGVGTASAAPSTSSSASASVPAPVRPLLAEAQRSAAHQAPTPARHAFRIPGDDDETFLGVTPGCASGRSRTKVQADVYASRKVKLDWVLTGSHLRKTGTVKTKADRAVALKLPKVRSGSYRLRLAVHGKADLLADETFDVLPCLVVKASCRAVTFTNPAGNPTAYVSYHGRHKKQEFTLELAPGASTKVRADYAKIDYDATTYSPDAWSGSLGHETVKVKQKCAHQPAGPAEHALQSSGFAGCGVSGAPATVTLSWSVQPSLTGPRFAVLDAAQHTVAQGVVKGGDDTDVALVPGDYTYRSFADGSDQPFEDVTFTVLGCVEITPVCRAIEVHNPNAGVVTAVVYSTDDDDTDVPGDGALTDVPAGGTVSIPWTGPGAWVLAFAQGALSGDGSTFVSLASALDDGEPVTTDVPQDC